MTVELELLLDLHDRVAALEAVFGTHVSALQKDLLHAIVDAKQRQREGWTRTGVAGCLTPARLEMAPEAEVESFTQPADAHDASAAIPPDVIDRLDRCAE